MLGAGGGALPLPLFFLCGGGREEGMGYRLRGMMRPGRLRLDGRMAIGDGDVVAGSIVWEFECEVIVVGSRRLRSLSDTPSLGSNARCAW